MVKNCDTVVSRRMRHFQPPLTHLGTKPHTSPPKSSTAYRDAESRSGRLADSVHFHVEAGEEAAGDVEGGVAVGLVALNAGADATLLAYSAKLQPELRQNTNVKVHLIFFRN